MFGAALVFGSFCLHSLQNGANLASKVGVKVGPDKTQLKTYFVGSQLQPRAVEH